MTKITGFDTFDVRFPTSRTLAGSDAMNPAPDYSAAYVVIRTDAEITALVDFRYLSEALTPDEALALLERAAAGRDERIAALHRDGYPAYSTGPGWLGYSDERLAALCEEAVAEGFGQVKIKVGAALADDKRRCAIARSAVGEDIGIAIDANQVWDVPTAIAWISELAPFRPAWVEEPTAPEDILGTAAIRQAVRPVRVATGEHVANPVMFKQLLQAGAIDIMQIDACRVAGVNENIANLLLAAKFGRPSAGSTRRSATRPRPGHWPRPWAAGIRGFDTAPHYGVGASERRLGSFLAGRPRDEFSVCTKVGRRLVAAAGDVQGEEGFYDIPPLTRVRDYSRDGVRRSPPDA